MNILGILTGERLTGSMFHRIVYPLSALADMYEDVNVKLNHSVKLLSDEELKKYDMVLIHSTSPDVADVKRLLTLCIPVVMDFDDYWILSTKHELYDEWKKRGETKRLMRFFDFNIHFTTTTPLLKSKIDRFAYNKGACVLPNGMIDDEGYRKPIKNSVVKFGWMGATNHITDLMHIQHLLQGYGYNISVPKNYELVFRNRFNYYNPLKVPEYLNLYNQFDAIVVPLDNNSFNTFKSELKLVEAGFYKKPVIISDVEPYSKYLKHGENCLVVKKMRHWAKYCKMISEDKELREKLGNNLHEDMKKHFDLRNTTKKRYEYFKNIIENV